MTRRALSLSLPALVASVLLLAGATACGNTQEAPDDEPSAASSPSASATPSPSADPMAAPTCADAWVTGQRLPEDYETCEKADGTMAKDELIECSSGQVIVVHANRQYGAAGGKIFAAPNVEKDKRFKRILRVCKG